ncbi:MAG TPA: hypothetical protein VLT33_34260, partial [Labilithrix sp.]|nr:hypothetical protein [Labilithrix sp.]
SADPADPTPDELAARGSCPAASGAGTKHEGIITADETWKAADGPHDVTFGLDIRATVTIEPCALVRVAKGVRISVGSSTDVGSLVARGTSQVTGGTRDVRPVNFDALDPASPWGQIIVYAKGTLDLSIAAIQNGGGETTDARGALVVTGVAGGTNDGEPLRSTTIDRVLIDKSASYGLNLEAWGALTEGSDKLWIRGSGSTELPSAIRIEPGIAATLPKTIVATGNVKDEILMLTSKTFTRNDTLVNRGLPYRQKGALYLNGSKDGAPVKLTVEPGVTLGFDENVGSGMYIGSGDTRQGILEAVGTADAPIVFTSAKTTKAAGDWLSLYFKSTPKTGSKISYARVEYAGAAGTTTGFGCGPSANDGAVFIHGTGPDDGGPASVFIDHTTFENIGGTTVIVSGWTDASGPNFTGDNTFGSAIPSCKVSKPRRSGGGDVCDGGRTTCW